MDDLATTLPLPASLALLLTAADGRRDVADTAFDAALAGAALTDLALRDLVVLQDKQVVPGIGTAVPTDPVLAGVLAQVRSSPKPRAAKWWVSTLSGRDLTSAVMASLIDSGLVTQTTKKVLGIFPSTTHPEVDGSTEQALRVQLVGVLEGTVPPTPAAASLIALVDAVRATKQQFGAVPRGRLQQIVEGNWAAPAVKAVIDELNAVVIGTIVATTAASSAAANS
jgi:hypothetical protein